MTLKVLNTKYRKKGFTWVQVSCIPKRKFKVTSSTGNHVMLSFDNSKKLSIGTVNNTFRILRTLSGKGLFEKYHGNEALVCVSIPEMTDILNCSKL